MSQNMFDKSVQRKKTMQKKSQDYEGQYDNVFGGVHRRNRKKR